MLKEIFKYLIIFVVLVFIFAVIYHFYDKKYKLKWIKTIKGRSFYANGW